MDVGADTVTLMLAMMAGMLLIAALVAGVCRLVGAARRFAARGREAEAGTAWVQLPAEPADADDQEAARAALWEVWLSRAGGGAALGNPAAAQIGAPPTRRRRLLLGAALTVALPASYVAWTLIKPPERFEYPEQPIVLTSIEKWADAVSMFEDKLRIRFSYRNRGDRQIDAFCVFFTLCDRDGTPIINERIDISNPVAPHQTATWTQTYWATYRHGFPDTVWSALLQRDIQSYQVEWVPSALVYADGEGHAFPRRFCGTLQDSAPPEGWPR